MKRLLLLAGGILLAAGVAVSASAAELTPTHFKIVGAHSPNIQFWRNQKPFWNKEIVEASGGKVTADITPSDQMGIDDFSLLRLLKLGVMDIVYFDVSKMAGDDPRFEGGDLAGLSLNIEQAKAASDAYQPIIDEIGRCAEHYVLCNSYQHYRTGGPFHQMNGPI